MAELASGHLAVRALKQAGVDHLFTLSGGHIFPLYDGCRHEDVTLVDTRHEQTAAFAAEGLAKLTRRPQVAALTAGPGVTNGISAIASAQQGGSPVLVIGGRAPQATWGRGSLQELDHCAFVAPLTKHATTSSAPEKVAVDVLDALRIAGTAHRGPTFVDVPLDVVFAPADEAAVGDWTPPDPVPVDTDALERAREVLARARRPVIVAGTDTWLGGAHDALRELAASATIPVIGQGMGRGLVPADDPLAVSRARGTALKQADVVVVVGTPLDFRLGFGSFGEAEVVHVADSVEGLATHAPIAAGVAGDLAAALEGLAAHGPSDEVAGDRRRFVEDLADVERRKRAEESPLLEGESDPVHPARVYGELRRVLDRDAIAIGDGGDFVSFAGKYLDRYEPGTWLDPGPYGCLGTGMGYGAAARLAHPDRQVCVLLGDGAAGFSLMDVDTLVRHRLPVVMVVGNNGMWALEKYPMQQLYDGWDVAADLQPGLRYDHVVQALGGAGETVEKTADLGPALERGFAAGVPYLVNVLTDPGVAYPRSTSLS